MKKTTLLLPLLLSLTTPVIADVYKWVDKDGNVHFGDRPTEQGTAIVVKNNNTNSTIITAPKETNWQQSYQDQKKEKAILKAKKKDQKKKVKAVCDYLKSKLAILTQSGRIYTMSPEGEKTYKSDNEISKNKQELNKAIKNNCR